jgi:hypothetical protein
LLAAVRSIAEREVGGSTLPSFEHEEPTAPWFRQAFEATIALPAQRPDEVRAALLSAVDRVNRVAAVDP